MIDTLAVFVTCFVAVLGVIGVFGVVTAPPLTLQEHRPDPRPPALTVLPRPFDWANDDPDLAE